MISPTVDYDEACVYTRRLQYCFFFFLRAWFLCARVTEVVSGLMYIIRGENVP